MNKATNRTTNQNTNTQTDKKSGTHKTTKTHQPYTSKRQCVGALLREQAAPNDT